MNLDPESSLSLDDLKGAFVYKYIKEDGVEKEVSYRISHFSIEFGASYDNPDNEWDMTGYELDIISVQLIPFEDGKWNTDKLVGMTLKSLKDYTIQLSSGHPKEWE